MRVHDQYRIEFRSETIGKERLIIICNILPFAISWDCQTVLKQIDIESLGDDFYPNLKIS